MLVQFPAPHPPRCLILRRCPGGVFGQVGLLLSSSHGGQVTHISLTEGPVILLWSDPSFFLNPLPLLPKPCDFPH